MGIKEAWQTQLFPERWAGGWSNGQGGGVRVAYLQQAENDQEGRVRFLAHLESKIVPISSFSFQALT